MVGKVILPVMPIPCGGGGVWWLSGACAASALSSRPEPGACGAAHEQIGPSGTDPQVVQGCSRGQLHGPGGAGTPPGYANYGVRASEGEFQSCGGRFGSIDGTANRFDQSRPADLSLIRERGLAA